jgi:hypothetical protein
MRTEELYQYILEKLYNIKDDKVKLTHLLNWLDEEDLDEINGYVPGEIPEEYKSIISQITDALNKGFVCFLNPYTFEIEQVQGKGIFDYEEYEEQNEDMIDEYGLNYIKWDDYIKFEPFDRTELLGKMEKFVFRSGDNKLKQQLGTDIEEERPIFRCMKVFEKAGRMEDWLSFKRAEAEAYVMNRLATGLKERRLTEESVSQ